MMVCICSCVSESDIIREIRKGYNTIDKLSDRLNVATTCGACLLTLEELIAKTKLDSTPPPSLQFVKIEG